MIERLSIDLSNYCSKQCPFCYNHSTKAGSTQWKPEEIISFAIDCVKNGTKAISLGGGEPFEYDGVFDVIDALFPQCYLSVTSNGLPLLNNNVWQELTTHKPDKIHLTIHHPDDNDEVSRVEDTLKRISAIGITAGLNLLVGATTIEYTKKVYSRLGRMLNPGHIILVPQRYSNTPTPQQLASVTNGKPFQSPSCLLECKKPTGFCSVSWDKKAVPCSFAPCKEPLLSLDYSGLTKALDSVKWKPCNALTVNPSF